ncbi:MAG: hypothetical protein ABWZ25_08735 [Chitinophagaceae bacterium]
MNTSMQLCRFVLVGMALVFSSQLRAQTLEQRIVQSSCQYLDSVKVESLVTPADKKSALSLVLGKAVVANQAYLNKDPRFAGKTEYEQGKLIGRSMANDILPLILKRCPKFASLLK